MQMTSLVLIRKFQTDCSKILFLGKTATAVRLGFRSSFATVWFNISDSIFYLWFLSYQHLLTKVMFFQSEELLLGDSV